MEVGDGEMERKAMTSSRTRPHAQTILAGLLAIAMMTPAGGHELTSDRISEGDDSIMLESGEEDLLFMNQGALFRPPDHYQRADGGYLLKFETDTCGLPHLRADRSLARRQSAFSDDTDAIEDDPFVEALIFIGRSLSAHPELAVVNDAVDRSCDDVVPLDEEPAPEDLTSWTSTEFSPLRRVRQVVASCFDSRTTNSPLPFGKSLCSPPMMT
jgi:hypothetical protein